MEIVARSCHSCGAGLEADGLVCSFCGASHVVVGGALAVACPRCGAGNSERARHCVQCRAPVVVTCPECRATSPHGSRYCQECQIEFRSYRRARLLQAPLRVPAEQVEARLVEWLEGRWFRARDLRARLRLIERTLVWVPGWELRARVTGRVQGQVAQTHYRTVSRQVPDGERWRTEVDSVPYQVWSEVSKEFDRAVVVREPGCEQAAGLQDVVDQADLGPGVALPLPGEALTSDGGARVFEPDLVDVEAFRRLRGRAEARLRQELLDRVERLEARWLGPALTLTFEPVWRVVYRYRRAHGEARLHGTTGCVAGRKVTLLDQWFG